MQEKISISEYRELKDLRFRCGEQELEINFLRGKIRELEGRLMNSEVIIQDEEEVVLEDVKTPETVTIIRLFDGAKFLAKVEDGFVVCEGEKLRVLNCTKSLLIAGYKII